MKNQKEYIANFLREAEEIVEQTTTESKTSRTGSAAPDITSQASEEQLRNLDEELKGKQRELTEKDKGEGSTSGPRP